MENRNTVTRSVIVTVSILLLGACAGKMNVAETPAEEATAEAAESAPAPAEAAAAETQEANKVVEVIPLDASANAAAPAADTQQAQAANAQATQPTTSPPDISNILTKFLDHRNTLWHSRDRTYRLYVGDQFESEYSPDNKTFVIMSDEPGSKLECKYATTDGKLDPQEAGQKKACNALISKLDNYVTNF